MVHDRISAAVQHSGMKQKFIAEQIGISESSFCAMLTGKRKIDVVEFFAICKVLKMNPDELFYYGIQREAV